MSKGGPLAPTPRADLAAADAAMRAGLAAERRRLKAKAARGSGARPPVIVGEVEVRARALAAEGMPVREAARALGVHYMTLTLWAKRRGLAFARDPRSPRHAWTGELAAAIRDCAARGLTTGQAAAELGLRKDSLRGWARRHGVTFQRPDFRGAKQAWWDAHPEAKARVMAMARKARWKPLTDEERRGVWRIRAKAPELGRDEVMRAVGREDLVLERAA